MLVLRNNKRETLSNTLKPYSHIQERNIKLELFLEINVDLIADSEGMEETKKIEWPFTETFLGEWALISGE